MFQRWPRALVGALLLSTVAHLALLLGTPWQARSWPGRAAAGDAPGRLGVRLQVAAAGASRLPSGREVRDTRDGRGVAALRREALSPLPPAQTETVRRGVSPQSAVALSSSATTVPTGPSGDRAEGIDADDLRAYRFNLALAARQGFSGGGNRQGRVDVSVTQLGGRAAAEVSVHRSSGQAALDREAVAMVTRAVALADLPRGMFGREFRLVLPLLFGAAE